MTQDADGQPTVPTDSAGPGDDHPRNPLEIVEKARAALKQERKRTQEEKEAFKTFLEHIRKLEVSDTPGSPTQEGSSIPLLGDEITNTGGDRQLAAVRSIFRQTVMAVDHYDEEYSDSYPESLAAELGEDLASAYKQATLFHPALKQGMVQAASSSIEEREGLLRALNREEEAIDRIERHLEGLYSELRSLNERTLADYSYGALIETHEELEAMASECDVLIEDRQQSLNEVRRSMALPEDIPDIAGYLYRDIEATYPLLDAIATIASLIHSAQERLEQELYSRA